VEIVNEPALRFDDGEFFRKFELVTAMPSSQLNDYRLSLLDHVQRFSEPVFIERMLGFLNSENPGVGSPQGNQVQ
jgi:hypothetical protein